MIDKSVLLCKDPNIEDQTVLEINRMPPRAALIPAKNAACIMQTAMNPRWCPRLREIITFAICKRMRLRIFTVPILTIPHGM